VGKAVLYKLYTNCEELPVVICGIKLKQSSRTSFLSCYKSRSDMLHFRGQNYILPACSLLIASIESLSLIELCDFICCYTLFCYTLLLLPARDAMLARVIAIATCLSVRLSVCPSRASIVSKRRKLAA